MSKETGCRKINLSTEESNVVVQGLRKAALYLRKKCELEPDNPATIALIGQAQELEKTAAQLDGIGEVACQFAASVEAARESDIKKLLSVTPAGWATAAAGIEILSENYGRDGVPGKAHTLRTLANKVTAVAGWVDSFLCTIWDEENEQRRGID